MESSRKNMLREKPKSEKMNKIRKYVELSDVKTFDKDLKKLKTKREKTFQAKVSKERKLKFKVNQNKGFTPGIVYLGHIPDGFTQKTMREYFTQFGDVGRIRLACSRRTGRSKGYAFIEFKCDEVAKIVAETMNNYFMFEKLLKCVYIPKDQARPDLFRGHNANHKLAHKKFLKEHNKTKDLKTQQKALKNRVLKLEQKKKKLAKLGIEFNFSLENNEKVKKILEKRKQTKNLLSVSKNLKKVSHKDSESSLNYSSLDNEDFSFDKMFSGGEITDASKHTLELDLSDDEISFKTPPNARKTYKKKEVNTESKFNNNLDLSKSNKYKNPKMIVNPFSIKPMIKPTLNTAEKKNVSLNFGHRKGRKSSNKTI